MKLVLFTRALLAILLLGHLSVTGTVAAEAERRELVFLTWSDYIDPEVVAEFEKKFNARISMVYFENDDARDDMLQESNGGIYDVVMVNGSMLDSYKRRGWLKPITTANVPNLAAIDPKWRNAYESSEAYTAAYFWGTLGIAYREDLVTTAMDSWMDLFSPPEELRGRIFMISQGRDLVGMSLKALGYSANSENRNELASAEKLLMEQKPFVKAYSYIALTENSALVKGDIAAATVFSGDALTLADLNPHIKFVLPKEGGNLWCDYLTVMASSKHAALAYEFLNFLNEPEIAARNAEFVNYATPNLAAEKHLPQEYFDNEIIYPRAEALEKSEIYTKLDPRIIKRRNEIFNRVLQ